MILHVTKQTKERFKLLTVDELTGEPSIIAKAVISRDSDDLLLNWGIKLFYFDGKKCIQLVNFASKFTLFLFDVKTHDFNNMGDIFAQYLLRIFEDDPQMQRCLNRMFEEDGFIVAERITNKSIIATLNHNYTDFALSGSRFWDYVQDSTLHSLRINHDINFNNFVSYKAVGKPDFYFPGEYFRELVIARYSSATPPNGVPFALRPR